MEGTAKLQEDKALQKVFVELRASLHSSVKAIAAQRNLKLPEAYTEALEMWLASVGGSAATPFGDITEKERDVLEAVLHLLRDDSVPTDQPWSLKPLLHQVGAAWRRSRGRRG